MTDMNFRALMEQDDNIQAVGTGEDGKTVLFVLDDSAPALAPYAERGEEVQIIRLDGPFEAWTYKDRMRPVPGGPSVGNWRITAGTVSGYVIDNETGELMMLSNWHVLDGDSGQVGDDIIQPGAADGGSRPSDVVAHLHRSVNVHSDLTVTVDCALARMVDQALIDENIIAGGKPHGSVDPYVGMWAQKTGRTSELSAGQIVIIDATVRVNYGTFSKSLQRCFMTGVPGGPGDSGSMYRTYGLAAIGLLFAGGAASDGTQFTVGCQMGEIERHLNVTVPMPNPRQKRDGIDVSKWQGEMNWQTAKAAGASVAVIRAGSIDNVTGECYEDTQFRRNAGLAPEYMPVGFYWYFRPNHNPILQADYFCDLIENTEWMVPPVIDVEEDGGKSPSEVASAVWVFLDRVQKRFNVRPMIYTSPGFWNAKVARSAWAKDYPLWVANWVNLGVIIPLLPEDWKGVGAVMWQYRVARNTGSHYGAQSSDIDLDVTYPAFEALLDGIEPPPPPEKAALAIRIVGQGTVTPGSGDYPLGSTVTLQATPTSGWRFVEWSGDITGDGNPYGLVMDDDKIVTATFEQAGSGVAVYEHNKGKVMAPRGVNIRGGPGTTYPDIGDLALGVTVDILETRKDASGNTWGRIGYNQWACMVYGAQIYIRYIMADE